MQGVKSQVMSISQIQRRYNLNYKNNITKKNYNQCFKY